MLRRLWSYLSRVFKLDELLTAFGDPRDGPVIPMRRITASIAIIFLARVGSLNAFRKATNSYHRWRRHLGGEPPHDDTIRRVAARIKPGDVRDVLCKSYAKVRRAKMLRPIPFAGVMVLLDGHECTCSELTRCSGCLERTVGKQKKRTQYYHRVVTAMLVGDKDACYLLDMEPERPGEGEIACALRLLDRVGKRFRRAFDIVCGDALYADTRVVKKVRALGKDLIAVLKKNRANLLTDAEDLFAGCAYDSVFHDSKGRLCEAHDAEGFTTWPQAGPVRVVRYKTTTHTRRQLSGKIETTTSVGYQVTTLAASQVSTQQLVSIARMRWMIENQGYNSLVNELKADHIYHHHPVAIEVFWLFALWCRNLFEYFWSRNLKACARPDRQTVRRRLLAELYGSNAPQQTDSDKAGDDSTAAAPACGDKRRDRAPP